VAGTRTVKAATADLMADGFGLSAYDPADLQTLFEQLRTLRLAAGDFSA
jgi:hypothetical protein